ncbi:hypothetical protein CYMTET_21657 [Cymbomonas tetramitiformis]|uniref:ZNF451 PIN-like domain-containing protein n=1 Tax=Cymbomonas tetramitiformis TaxID=36881 RepID=A0AAE0G1Y9_9CHLO|nr:hypothetical protein CYMTET_21657 [Cymbomonas tetramitiformis]
MSAQRPAFHRRGHRYVNHTFTCGGCLTCDRKVIPFGSACRKRIPSRKQNYVARSYIRNVTQQTARPTPLRKGDYRNRHRLTSAVPAGSARNAGPLSQEDAAKTQVVVLYDLDNCMHLFSRIRVACPEFAIIRGFVGTSSKRRRLRSKELVQWLDELGLAQDTLYNGKVGLTVGSSPVWVTLCGSAPNAADFALSLEVGRLDLALPLRVPFFIVSNDAGFDEVLEMLPERTIRRLDPKLRKGTIMERQLRQMRTIDKVKELYPFQDSDTEVDKSSL